jgi:hypothetical protein
MGKVKTIGSISISRSSRDLVHIRIEDEHSGDKILELDLTLSAYGLLCTGLSGVKGVMEVNTDAKIAMDRLTKTVVTPDIKKYQDKALTSSLVEAHFKESNLADDGWILFDDGTRSQQNYKQGYSYTLKRYVPVENPTDMEGRY